MNRIARCDGRGAAHIIQAWAPLFLAKTPDEHGQIDWRIAWAATVSGFLADNGLRISGKATDMPWTPFQWLGSVLIFEWSGAKIASLAPEASDAPFASAQLSG
jgi:hypothetical protein